MKNRIEKPGISVGFISLFMIFMVLCLVTFAILALSSASADLRLTSLSVSKNENYYKSDGEVQKLISEIDAKLASARKTAADDGAYYSSVADELKGVSQDLTYDAESRTVTIVRQIDLNTTITAVLQINPLADELRYSTLSYKMAPILKEVEEPPKPVWKG